MYLIKLGEKRSVRAGAFRNSGTGAIALTSPQYRILDSAKAELAAWASANWDSAEEVVHQLIDTSQSPVNAAGTYYVELRGTIGAELYVERIRLKVEA